MLMILQTIKFTLHLPCRYAGLQACHRTALHLYQGRPCSAPVKTNCAVMLIGVKAMQSSRILAITACGMWGCPGRWNCMVDIQ